MTYLRTLALLNRWLYRAMERCDPDKRPWAELAWLDGGIFIRRIRYVDRIQKLSGIEDVEIVGPSVKVYPTIWSSAPTLTTGGDSTTFRYIYNS